MKDEGQQLEDFEAYCRQATRKQLDGILERESEFASVDTFRAKCKRIVLAEIRARDFFETKD